MMTKDRDIDRLIVNLILDFTQLNLRSSIVHSFLEFTNSIFIRLSSYTPRKATAMVTQFPMVTYGTPNIL